MAATLKATLNTFFQTQILQDFLLPFLIVFTIIFAILQKTKILGEDKTTKAPRKNFNLVVALVLGLGFVIPHITGRYPPGYDPVAVMNQSLPHISLVGIACIMLLILLGVFNKKMAKTARPIILLISLGFVIYIFGAALNLWSNPSSTFSWWTDDLTQLLIILAVFGIIVTFITRSELTGDDKAKGGFLKRGWTGIGHLIGDDNDQEYVWDTTSKGYKKK